jgi:hypothetical protein
MPIRTLPEGTVALYDDGPNHPETPVQHQAEAAYRAAFAAAIRSACTWEDLDEDRLAAARRDRATVKRQMEIPIATAELWNAPDLDSEQIVYRAGHEVAAASARGTMQGLEAVARCWKALKLNHIPEVAIGPVVIQPWAQQVDAWAAAPINPKLIIPPPAWDDCISPEERHELDLLQQEVADGEWPVKLRLKTKTVRQLLNENPDLRRPVIHGLLREGETMNVIASPKIGKSWLVTDLALSVATGRPWLETYPTERGSVLICDNELHRETTAHRIPKVMAARGISIDDVGEQIHVANVRGDLKDIFSLGSCFESLQPGQFKVIVLDAFYRFMPRDSDENDNGTMSQVYNHLDRHAAQLGCSFVLIHHSSKGNQSGKAVTDVGAGAGSQSRATDTHLVLRPHEEESCVVLDAAVRSWPPIPPRCLRWTFPVWVPDDRLDPAALRPERPRRRPKTEERANPPERATERPWDALRFVEAFVGPTPATTLAIIQAAETLGLSERKATKLLKQAEADGLVHRWRFGSTVPVQFSTNPQANHAQ